MVRKALADIETFLNTPTDGVGPIHNEHGLQLEIGIHLRCLGYNVQFERPFKLEIGDGAAKRPKRELDILVTSEGQKLAVELKTPLAGRVPETMYDFCADIHFVERLMEIGAADFGACLMVTNDKQFWNSGLRGEGIYSFFRSNASTLTGLISKPTGAKDSTIAIAGRYSLAGAWKPLINSALLNNASYLLVEILPRA